jgi:hypothetical protein
MRSFAVSTAAVCRLLTSLGRMAETTAALWRGWQDWDWMLAMHGICPHDYRAALLKAAIP